MMALGLIAAMVSKDSELKKRSNTASACQAGEGRLGQPLQRLPDVKPPC